MATEGYAENAAPRLLVVDDEENMRHMLAALLTKAGYAVETAADGEQALAMVAQTTYDFILCDLKMPRMGGMDFLQAAEDRLADATVIVMSAYGTVDLAVEAMKRGAYDFISKPFKTDEVLLTLKKAEERERLKRENRSLRERIRKLRENYSFGRMVGQSPCMQQVFKLAEKASRFETTVLITGESGTGKELMARALHDLGRRAQRPFVPVNCGSIPESLLESELFGHVKGAFTGADRNRDGLFVEADGGTLFLDEIGELPLLLQVKLLRVIQENEIRPVGATKIRKIDVRIIAATARDLNEEVSGGAFREDLFYRLNVFTIKMPPLRQWREDIPLLARHFITLFNEKLDLRIQGVTPEAARLLSRYHWPGNVRELENAIERAMVLADDAHIKPENLPDGMRPLSAGDDAAVAVEGYSLKAARRVIERQLIVKALTATGGNRTQASQLLEISHPSLLSKMKAYGIDL